MPQTMSIDEAAVRLPALARAFRQAPGGRPSAISRGGRPVLAVMAWEFYTGLVKMAELLSDEELVSVLREGLEEDGNGADDAA